MVMESDGEMVRGSRTKRRRAGTGSRPLQIPARGSGQVTRLLEQLQHLPLAQVFRCADERVWMGV